MKKKRYSFMVSSKSFLLLSVKMLLYKENERSTTQFDTGKLIVFITNLDKFGNVNDWFLQNVHKSMIFKLLLETKAT